VIQAQHLGDITLVQLALGDLPGSVVNITLAGRQRRQIKEGERHSVYLDQATIHVMPVKS
jgi:hypothetical protein